MKPNKNQEEIDDVDLDETFYPPAFYRVVHPAGVRVREAPTQNSDIDAEIIPMDAVLYGRRVGDFVQLLPCNAIEINWHIGYWVTYRAREVNGLEICHGPSEQIGRWWYRVICENGMQFLKNPRIDSMRYDFVHKCETIVVGVRKYTPPGSSMLFVELEDQLGYIIEDILGELLEQLDGETALESISPEERDVGLAHFSVVYRGGLMIRSRPDLDPDSIISIEEIMHNRHQRSNSSGSSHSSGSRSTHSSRSRDASPDTPNKGSGAQRNPQDSSPIRSELNRIQTTQNGFLPQRNADVPSPVRRRSFTTNRTRRDVFHDDDAPYRRRSFTTNRGSFNNHDDTTTPVRRSSFPLNQNRTNKISKKNEITPEIGRRRRSSLNSSSLSQRRNSFQAKLKVDTGTLLGATPVISTPPQPQSDTSPGHPPSPRRIFSHTSSPSFGDQQPTDHSRESTPNRERNSLQNINDFFNDDEDSSPVAVRSRRGSFSSSESVETPKRLMLDTSPIRSVAGSRYERENNENSKGHGSRRRRSRRRRSSHQEGQCNVIPFGSMIEGCEVLKPAGIDATFVKLSDGRGWVCAVRGRLLAAQAVSPPSVREGEFWFQVISVEPVEVLERPNPMSLTTGLKMGLGMVFVSHCVICPAGGGEGVAYAEVITDEVTGWVSFISQQQQGGTAPLIKAEGAPSNQNDTSKNDSNKPPSSPLRSVKSPFWTEEPGLYQMLNSDGTLAHLNPHVGSSFIGEVIPAYAIVRVDGTLTVTPLHMNYEPPLNSHDMNEKTLQNLNLNSDDEKEEVVETKSEQALVVHGREEKGETFLKLSGRPGWVPVGHEALLVHTTPTVERGEFVYRVIYDNTMVVHGPVVTAAHIGISFGKDTIVRGRVRLKPHVPNHSPLIPSVAPTLSDTHPILPKLQNSPSPLPSSQESLALKQITQRIKLDNKDSAAREDTDTEDAECHGAVFIGGHFGEENTPGWVLVSDERGDRLELLSEKVQNVAPGKTLEEHAEMNSGGYAKDQANHQASTPSEGVQYSQGPNRTEDKGEYDDDDGEEEDGGEEQKCAIS